MDRDEQPEDADEDSPGYWVREVPEPVGGDFARYVAARLDHVIGWVMKSRTLPIRAVAYRGLWFLRCEVFADDAERLAGWIRVVAAVDRFAEESSEGDGCALDERFRHERIDTAEAHPVWYAAVPGVDYMEGYEHAYAAWPEFEEALSARMLSGPLSMVPVCGQDGRGALRFYLTPRDGDRLTGLLHYIGKNLTPGGGQPSP